MFTDQLRATPLFETLGDSELERIAERMSETEVDLGAVLAREGDAADQLFVVTAGTAAVTVGGDVVTMLRAGNTFGEIGLVERDQRTANVVAVTPMRLLTMGIEDFNRLAEEIPELAGRANALAQARLARTEG